MEPFGFTSTCAQEAFAPVVAALVRVCGYGRFYPGTGEVLEIVRRIREQVKSRISLSACIWETQVLFVHRM